MNKLLQEAMEQSAQTVKQMIDRLLPSTKKMYESVLWEAMRYGCLAGGKRIRPFLVLESAKLFDIDLGSALHTAVAVELIHCYSLIHDDLPAMDNSDLRHGCPTVHARFGEAIAILAGDGLLARAFEILSLPETHPDTQVRCHLIEGLAKASGAQGIVGGQMLDLIAEKTQYNKEDVVRLQSMKTGALIEFAAQAGAILAQANTIQRQALIEYARNIGLAFQIKDDLLDVESDQDQIGKPIGQDQRGGKATFVALLGISRARQWAYELVEQAKKYLDIFAEKQHTLAELAEFIVERRV